MRSRLRRLETKIAELEDRALDRPRDLSPEEWVDLFGRLADGGALGVEFTRAWEEYRAARVLAEARAEELPDWYMPEVEPELRASRWCGWDSPAIDGAVCRLLNILAGYA